MTLRPRNNNNSEKEVAKISQIHLNVHGHVEAGAFSNGCAQDGALREGGEAWRSSSLEQQQLTLLTPDILSGGRPRTSQQRQKHQKPLKSIRVSRMCLTSISMVTFRAEAAWGRRRRHLVHKDERTSKFNHHQDSLPGLPV